MGSFQLLINTMLTGERDVFAVEPVMLQDNVTALSCENDCEHVKIWE